MARAVKRISGGLLAEAEDLSRLYAICFGLCLDAVDPVGGSQNHDKQEHHQGDESDEDC